ncbi:putative phosphatase regulatory subunit, partial [Cooperia oncophora]
AEVPFFRDTRSHTLPSALRRSRSKACAKRVRFADALGLDLEKRQYFTEKDPDLFLTPPSSPTPGRRLVLSNFVYRSESEYNQRARDQMVCLAKLRVHGHTINGQVNVANIAFCKEVAIRYTTSNWATHDEVAATYGHTVFGADNVDAFVFSLMLPADVKVRRLFAIYLAREAALSAQCVNRSNFTTKFPKQLVILYELFQEGQCQFCVRFTVDGREFWDNNSANNYCVDIVPDASLPPSSYERSPVPTITPVAPVTSFFTPRRLRRWGRAQEESDDESSRVYIPRRRIVL